VPGCNLRRAFLSISAFLVLAGCQGSKEASSQNAASTVGEPANGSLIAEIHNSFRVAATPQTRSLLGTWVMTKTVSPGHAEADAKGIRKPGSAEDSYDWSLTFFTTAGEQLRLISVEGDGGGEMSDAVFSSVGDLTFDIGGGKTEEKDFRCRSGNPVELVCLWIGHEAESGVEFLKVSR
jgi:hypothetical protein